MRAGPTGTAVPSVCDRPDRKAARPGGFGAGDCPIIEENRNPWVPGVCARHDQVEAGEATA
ncbi:hypothetical protein TNCT6_15280 [Streptomyces sp. 6-11-2]|nr:hypothetical protein TNCT6_15280 [Streptomyces sp. 6-11-2]